MTSSVFAAAVVAAPSLRNPHTLIFFIGALLFLGMTQLAAWHEDWDLARQRRFYWVGTGGAAVCALLAGLPDWSSGLIFGVGVIVLMAITAYFLGSYIKIGDRIWAFHLRDGGPLEKRARNVARGSNFDTSAGDYGGAVTAVKFWWLTVVGVAICSINVAFHFVKENAEKPWLWVALSAVLVFLAIGLGYGDGATGNSIARRQYAQFTIITVITPGVFTVIYLLSFAIGRRLVVGSKA